MPPAVLGYWAIRGIGQPCRLVLHWAGVDFEDKQYTVGVNADGSHDLSAWTSDKATLAVPFPNLPYYINGELRLTQSHAIMLHVAREGQLDGSTPLLRAHVLMLLELSRDVRDPFVSLCYGGAEAAFEGAKEAYVNGTLAPILAKLEAFAAGGPWLLSEFTYVDLVWYDLLQQFVALSPGCLAAAPKLAALVAAVDALPLMASFKARPTYIDRPFNNVMALFK